MSLTTASSLSQAQVSPINFPSVLRTPRLVLSQFSLTSTQDVEYAITLFSQIATIDGFLAFCMQRAPLPWADTAIVYLIRETQKSEGAGAGNGEVVGHVSLAHSLEDRQPRVINATEASASTRPPASAVLDTDIIPDIGWRLKPQFQGKGYATEAVNRFLQYLCEEDSGPRFEVLSVFTPQENVKSLALAGRVGFVDVIGVDGEGVGFLHDEAEDVDGDGGNEVGYRDRIIGSDVKGLIECERRNRKNWFGVRPAGWLCKGERRDRGRDEELRASVAKMFQ